MTSSKINTILKNRKNKNKKGFSLVELIVVLVIMAILAAALIPTLIGYINQTRQSNAKNEAAACVSAGQTIVSSAYADPSGNYVGKGSSNTIKFTFTDTAVTVNDADKFKAEIEYLSEVTKNGGSVTSVTVGTNGSISALTYESGNGETIYYTTDENGVGSYSTTS